MSNQLTPVNTFMQLLVMCTIQKNSYLMARFCILTGFARRINFLIGRVMIPLVWIKYRGYNELIRQQILKARKYRRTELLYSQIEEVHNNKLVLNITYYSIFFSKLKSITWMTHFLLTPDREHSKVFENILKTKRFK